MESIRTPGGAPALVYENTETLGEAFAQALVETIGERLRKAPLFTLALTGGKTPESIYQRLGEGRYVHAVDWEKVKIFFSDERTVRPDHPDSNYRMAWEAWLKNGPIPRWSIHRMRGEAAGKSGDWAEAAAHYEKKLRREVPGAAGADRTGSFPVLDLILLGMGADGHVASLFPGTRALEETHALAAANPVPQQNTTRLTLTYPTINAARKVWMLVTGEAKAERVAQALGYTEGGEALPVSRVRPVGGQLQWWLDSAAAGGIQR